MTEGTRTSTEADAVAQLAEKPAVITAWPEGANPRGTLIGVPPDWRTEVIDFERFAEMPARSKGTSFVHTATAFVASLKRRMITDQPSPVIYADEATNALVALLNDDDDSTPGWRDYRVALQLRATPEWEHWRSKDGVLMGQESFAEHIEDGLNELNDPAPAVMLDIAQTFHAHTDATFKGGTRLDSGAQQFQYEEEVKAGAGAAGTVEIPSRLTLALAPFYGSARYEVGAWFRYRLNKGSLTLGYKLDRPHDVTRAAFSAVQVAVAEGLPDTTLISGPAPEARA